MIRTSKYTNTVFFYASAAFTLVTVYLFYVQSLDLPNDVYNSDVPAHIRTASNLGYSMLHFAVSVIGNILAFSGVDKLVLFPIVMILILAASIFLTLVLIRDFLRRLNSGLNPYLIDAVAFSLMFVSMIIIDPGAKYLYLGVGTPNPWHNPTNIFCKPFSILAFVYLLKAHENARGGRRSFIDLALLSGFAFLSMWAKPAFLLSFLPAAAIILLIEFLWKKISFANLLLMGIALLPSLIPQFLTYQKVYNRADAGNAVTIVFGDAWRHYSDNIPLSILLATAFPLFVLIMKFRSASFPLLLSFTNYVISLLIFFFIAEQGPRKFDLNFGWIYIFGIFFFFLAASGDFFLMGERKGLQFKIGTGLFVLHLVSGLFYFGKILFGFSFA